MSRCSPFPPPGYIVSRERYEELIDFIKVLKEKLRKETKKNGRQMREKGKEMRENKICKVELEAEEEDEFSNERKRRRKDAETETEDRNQFQFEGISSITEEESDDSTGNNNKTTTTGKRELSTSEETEDIQLQLEKLFDAAAALPPVNLDWLYPDTMNKTKTSKGDDDERRGAEERHRSESILSCSWTGAHAQYLHEVDTFALPYVLPF